MIVKAPDDLLSRAIAFVLCPASVKIVGPSKFDIDIVDFDVWWDEVDGVEDRFVADKVRVNLPRVLGLV